MDLKFINHIRKNLVERRDNLSTWLTQTTPAKKNLFLGSEEEQKVRDHVETLDEAITKTEDHTLGECVVCHEHVQPKLLEMDYTCCVCLEHLSQNERQDLEMELELAQNVQQTLLPQAVPEIPGLKLAVYSRPAQIIGGDYFDFFNFSEQWHGLAMADVAGHGISASLQISSVQTLLRTLAPASTSPAGVVHKVQDLFSHNIRFTTFVTLFLGSYDAEKQVLNYCNAGHPPPLLVRWAGDEPMFEWLHPTGPALGLIEEADFGEGTINLKPGDLLVTYTDGVTEAVNHEQKAFGEDRLAAVVSELPDRQAREVVQAIRDKLFEFSGGNLQADDITIMAGRVGQF